MQEHCVLFVGIYGFSCKGCLLKVCSDSDISASLRSLYLLVHPVYQHL